MRAGIFSMALVLAGCGGVVGGDAGAADAAMTRDAGDGGDAGAADAAMARDAGDGGDAGGPGIACDGLDVFPDPVLDGLVRQELAVSAADPLTAAQLAAITELEYVRGDAGAPLRSLEGAQCLTGLEVLTLDARHLPSDTDADRIRDVTPLAGLRSLRELTIRDASFDLTPLGGLVQLTVLRLDYGVPGTLDAPGSLDPLEPLVNLVELDASDGCVEDIAALAAMTQLETLDLYSNCIRDLTPLEALTQLRTLDVTDNFYECADVAESLAIIRGHGATVVDDCP